MESELVEKFVGVFGFELQCNVVSHKTKVLADNVYHLFYLYYCCLMKISMFSFHGRSKKKKESWKFQSWQNFHLEKR